MRCVTSIISQILGYAIFDGVTALLTVKAWEKSILVLNRLLAKMDPSATEKEDSYLNAMDAYGEKAPIMKTMTDFVQEVATHVMANITKDGIPVFRVLGVGSGQGQSDLRILTGIATAMGSSQTKRPTIHSVIIEPNDTMMAEFQTSVSSSAQPLTSLADASFEWHLMSFEKFTESFSQIGSFHMVHFVASLYYMDAETSLKISYQWLARGGAMFCTVGPEESFFPKLSRKLHGKVDLGSIHKFYTEVDLVNIAVRNNWKYEELWRTNYSVDISSCFDESSEEGSLLLDFLTHKQDFRATADEAFYNEVVDFLNEQSISDDNGRKLIKPEITAVVIYK